MLIEMPLREYPQRFKSYQPLEEDTQRMSGGASVQLQNSFVQPFLIS